MRRFGEQRGLIVVFAATTLLAALLLFQVQPIISRYILPWFGGTPAVWTTAMLFFQTVLFAGYVYAHWSVHYVKPRWQVVIHLALLLTAVLSLPFVPAASWKPIDGASGGADSAVAGGLRRAAVFRPRDHRSAGPGVVQPDASGPFSLSAVFDFEYRLARGAADVSVSHRAAADARFAGDRLASRVLVVCSVVRLCGDSHSDGRRRAAPAPAESAPPLRAPPRRGRGKQAAAIHLPTPHGGRRLLWLILPALASVAFLATTSYSCQDTPVVPFLWVAPLSLYLLSFVICFDHQRWYRPCTTAATLLVIYAAALIYLHQVKFRMIDDRLEIDIGLSFAGLFCLCMICHGELVRLKPDPRYLTSFYLMVAAGGAVGGLFVGLIAPLIFSGYDEWYLALWGGLVLALAILIGTDERGLFRRQLVGFLPATMIFAAALVAAGKLAVSKIEPSVETLAMRRNFYGVLTVQKYMPGGDDTARVLLNGHIMHGLQFVDADRRTVPTTYYGRASGIGWAIDSLQSQSARSLNIGAIGLGTGTLAAYLRPQDHIVFYEVNPAVLTMCRQYFSYLADARARTAGHEGSLSVVMGDGRLSLERELGGRRAPPPFDVLVVDAFSGDGIPTHLLTREAGDVYRRRLAADGVLAIHITNPHLDLAPVVRGLADAMRLRAIEIDSQGNLMTGDYSADWMLLTNNARLLAAVAPVAKREAPGRPAILWTDDYCGLFRILKL